MAKLNVPGYGGKCRIGGRTYYYKTAGLNDAADIAEIYKQTKIDKSNYMDRLDPLSPGNFGRKGGMFIVLDQKGIEEEIAGEHNFWAVFRTEDGNAAGSFWFSLENESYAGLKYEHMPHTVYPREIIVSREYGGKNLAKVMYYTIAGAMLSAGYTMGAADLYKVVGYDAGNGRVDLDMVNMPSRRSIEAIGAEFAEPLPVKEVVLDGITVYIQPQMYLFYYDKIRRGCEEYFADNDIIVTEGEAI